VLFYGAGSSGIKVGEKVTADKLLDLPAFSFAKKIVDREYFEFGGPRQLPVLGEL